MRRSGDRKIYGRLSAAQVAAAFFCAVCAASSGCGGGAGHGSLVTQGNFPTAPGTSSPAPGSPGPSDTPNPLPTASPTIPAPQQPAVQLADLSEGGSWKYLTYPGTTGSYSKPSPLPSGYKYVALTPPGSPLTAGAGCASTDTNIPGAVIRLSGTSAAAGNPYYQYDGTYRQDSATRDVYLLRLPTGEKLDTPAKVLPGTWSANTEIRSQFVVGGDVKADYRLTVKGAEILETSLGSKAVWLVSTSIHSVGPKGKDRLQTSKQWFEPTSGNYLQAMSRDAVMVLDDLTLVEILDDEKIISYKVNP